MLIDEYSFFKATILRINWDWQQTSGRQQARPARRCVSVILRLVAQVFGAVLKFGQAVEKYQIDFADGTVALLGHEQLRQTTQILAVAPVNLFTKDKR